jgi:hypothetical protein
MNNIKYKGFNIAERKALGSIVIQKNIRYYVQVADFICPGTHPFREDGYPTLNHAKGAVTNHLKAVEKQHEDLFDDVSDLVKEDDMDVALSHLEHVIASKIFTKSPKSVVASRNKREGHMFGKVAGAVCRGKTRKGSGWLCSAGSYNDTRKQRKQFKLQASRNI